MTTEQQIIEMTKDEIKEWERKNISGYDILRMPGCPHSLPTARSMTQAAHDYYNLMPNLIIWYSKQSKTTNP